MPYPPRPSRRTSYQQQANAGNSISPAMLDAEMNDTVEIVDQLNTFVRGVTTSSGALKNLSSATAQALAGSQAFSATASQTVFITTIAYVAAFTNLNVRVFSAGLVLDPTTVSVANNGGFLQVTIPAQAALTVVLVEAFESGSGLATRLADTASGANGANMVGLQDTGALVAATTVEGAIAEIVTTANALAASLGTIASLWRRDGTNAATADISMGSHKLTNLVDGASAQDAATYAQLSAVNQTLTTLANSFLKKDGTNAMTGQLNFGTQRGINLGTPTLSTDAATKLYVDNLLTQSTPVGAVLPFAGSSAPAGWLICNGTTTGNRTTHSALFALIGTTYGAGDGSTTFDLPNPAGRTVLGAGSGLGNNASGSGRPTGTALTARAAGQWFGEETHTMTASELVAHTHVYRWGQRNGGSATNGPGTDAPWSASDIRFSTPTDSAGSTTPFNVVQPGLVFNFIIKY